MASPPTRLSLAPDVHAVAVGPDLVVLDVLSDAYLCLVGAAAVIQLEADGHVTVSDPRAREALSEAGLISAGKRARAGRVSRRPTLGPPVIDAAGAPTAATLLRILRAGLATELAFRRQTFAEILAWAKAPAGDAPSAARKTSPGLLAAAAEFARLRVWAPFDGACLKRSYMMLRYLRLCGHDADWVIGVRTWPFVAHCWLQVGDRILDDDVERIAAYHPILVV